jgi:hypothetical protein
MDSAVLGNVGLDLTFLRLTLTLFPKGLHVCRDEKMKEGLC